MENENNRHDAPQKRPFKSILKVLDNNYTHSLSKAAIHLQFRDIVDVQGYDKASWEQWSEGLAIIGEAVGMNEHARERLRLKELRKARARARRANYHAKFGFAETIKSREDAERIVKGITDREDFVTMLMVHTEAMKTIKIANMRMHIALGIEEHKALLAREYAEDCEMARRRLLTEIRKLQKELAQQKGLDAQEQWQIYEDDPENEDNYYSSSFSSDDDDDLPLPAEHCPLFNSDTRVLAMRAAQQQLRHLATTKPRAAITPQPPQQSPQTTAIENHLGSITRDQAPRIVAKLSRLLFNGGGNDEARERVEEPIEVSRREEHLASTSPLKMSSPTQKAPDGSPLILVDTPATPAMRSHHKSSPNRALLFSPSTSSNNTPPSKPTIMLDDGPLSPLRLMEVKEAIRVDEKARMELDDEEDRIESAQEAVVVSTSPRPPVIESQESVPLLGWFCRMTGFLSPPRSSQG